MWSSKQFMPPLLFQKIDIKMVSLGNFLSFKLVGPLVEIEGGDPLWVSNFKKSSAERDRKEPFLLESTLEENYPFLTIGEVEIGAPWSKTTLFS